MLSDGCLRGIQAIQMAEVILLFIIVFFRFSLVPFLLLDRGSWLQPAPLGRQRLIVITPLITLGSHIPRDLFHAALRCGGKLLMEVLLAGADLGDKVEGLRR
jgi:hypothetical protein